MERGLRDRLPAGGFTEVSAQRSQMMAAVRGKRNKTTERRLRMALARACVTGWTLTPKGVPGNPDFFFQRERVAVFVDGCFWHGCARCGHTPSTNTAFWAAKIVRNRERDEATTEKLSGSGIYVLRFWEHELHENLKACVNTVKVTLLASAPP
jgi:DNA mismatch endonuclease (patch repair protein)